MVEEDIAVKDAKPLTLVSVYLMSSYLYYEHDTAVISDEAFDAICKRLIEIPLLWETHAHAHLVDVEALKAGTGYHLTKDYPNRVKFAAKRWLKSATGRDIDVTFTKPRKRKTQ
ncbi:DNA ligase LigA-related protein [Aestuariivirga sp. YIM B02566]|uniref:Uncharacterized protein n=1 Tax=Taklimakanibacter albus TaxID=2800327 RepID=A0ACC5RGJ7_9HYPH|nr:hypothetical protein [Aestuariivirga sp. YIM B02566]MBK1871538.1 hypothetical protein [Aestuariivirga sp. YIM B02566]